MATAVSAWGKPGAWALDSEAHEEELVQKDDKDTENDHSHYEVSDKTLQPLADFPSLSAAVATKSKKKKPQVLSLSEFATGKAVTHGSAKSAHSGAAKGLTPDELLILPTGPRERSAEELERSSSRLGGGFRSYGSGESGRSRYSNGEDSSRWGSSRVSDETRRNGGFNREFNRESAPSRADEIDDWGAGKKSVVAAAPGYERRERSGGFFDSHSRADESDSWVTKKSFVATEPRRFGSGGFENSRDRRLGFEGFQKESSDGSEADSDTWLKKKGEGEESAGLSGSGRPRLLLQPRTLPVNNGEQQLGLSSTATKSKGSNPFGAARPREEVLAEKGQDWKKLDEQHESVKIKETTGSTDGPSQWKKSFGSGDGRASPPESRTERSWRKAEELADAPPPREETVNEDEGEVEK